MLHQPAPTQSFSTSVNGSFTDQALGAATETFTGTALWSDGVESTVNIYADGSFSKNRVFLDDDPSGTPSDVYTATITITDDDGGSDSAVSPVVTVLNTASTIDSLESDSEPPSSSNDGNVSISGTFSDFSVNVIIADDDGGVTGQSIVVSVTGVDNVAPTADIVDVTPDPRNTSVGVVTINFDEDVTVNFDSIITADANGDGVINLLDIQAFRNNFGATNGK